MSLFLLRRSTLIAESVRPCGDRERYWDKSELAPAIVPLGLAVITRHWPFDYGYSGKTVVVHVF
jgi:hypothetical protein